MTYDKLRLRSFPFGCETVFIALCVVLVCCQQPHERAGDDNDEADLVSNVLRKIDSSSDDGDHGNVDNSLFDHIDGSKSGSDSAHNNSLNRVASAAAAYWTFDPSSTDHNGKKNHEDFVDSLVGHTDDSESHADYDYDNPVDHDYDDYDDNAVYGDESVDDDKMPHIILDTGGSESKNDAETPKSKTLTGPETASVSSEADTTAPVAIRCAYYRAPKVLPGSGNKPGRSKGDGGEGRNEKEDNPGDVSARNGMGNATEWEVDSVNYTTMLCEPDRRCYTMWLTDPDQDNKLEVKSQGCWLKTEGLCEQSVCVADPGTQPNTRFCCCNSDMCNIHLRDSGGAGARAWGRRAGGGPGGGGPWDGGRTTPLTAVVVSSSVGPLVDNSYREKTIIIALASVLGVALLVVLAYLPYRLCLTHKPLLNSPQSSSGTGSAGGTGSSDISTNGYMPVPDLDWDLLKFDEMVARGQFSEVWKGSLGSQEVAIKVYQNPYKQYYLTECTCYTLPFIEHENLVKFYGARENNRGQGRDQNHHHRRQGQGQTTLGSTSTSGSSSGVGSGSDLHQIDSGTVYPDGGYLMLLEYHSLGSLTGYLKHHTLDSNLLFSMGQDIARGLAHLHNQINQDGRFKPALAHRDLNTRNILVTSDLRCVLTDLGFCTAMMGPCLLKNGTIESTEQASLAEVGTIRYLAPEVFDGAVNLWDCEASLKQVDVYSLGLVLWELAFRCVHLYQGAPIPDYQLPFQAEAGLHPSFAQMQTLVVRYKTRPKFPEVWKDSNPAVRSLKETIEDCWDNDPEARLTAPCVQERFSDMAALWVQGSRQRGMTSTLNTTKNLSGSHYQHTVSPSAFVSNGMAFLPEFVDEECNNRGRGGGVMSEEDEEESKMSREERSVRLSLIQNGEENEYREVSGRGVSGTRRSASSSDFSKAAMEEVKDSTGAIVMGNSDNDVDDDTDDGGFSITCPLISRTSDDKSDADMDDVRRSLTRDVSMSGSTIDTWLIPTPSADDENKAIVTPTSLSSSSTSLSSPFVSTSPSNYSANTYPHFHSTTRGVGDINYYNGSPSTSSSSSTSASSGLKSSNVNSSLNSTVLRPHQGRNPTVERNTHKSSDEELRVSGNHLIGRGSSFLHDDNGSNIQVNIDTNGEVLSLLPLKLNTTVVPKSDNVSNASNLYPYTSGDRGRPILSPVGAVANSNLMNGYDGSMEAAESSSLVQNDSLSHHHHQPRHAQQQQQQQYNRRHHPHHHHQHPQPQLHQQHLRSSSGSTTAAPIPYLQNQVNSSHSSPGVVAYQNPDHSSSTSSSSSSSTSRPKIANVLSNGDINGNGSGDPNSQLLRQPQPSILLSSTPSAISNGNENLGDDSASQNSSSFTRLSPLIGAANSDATDQQKTQCVKDGQKSIKNRLLASKPISRLGQAMLRMKTGSHINRKNGESITATKIKNQKNSCSPVTVQAVELRVPDLTSTLIASDGNETPRSRSNVSSRHINSVSNGGPGGGIVVVGSAGSSNGEYYNGGLETSPTQQDGYHAKGQGHLRVQHQWTGGEKGQTLSNSGAGIVNGDATGPGSSSLGPRSFMNRDTRDVAVMNPSNHSNGAVDYPSNHTNGAVDYPSNHTNGAVDYPSNHTNGAVDYPSNHTNGAVDYPSNHTNGAVDYPSNHTNGAVDYPSNHTNGAVDYPSNHSNGAVDYPSNHSNGAVGYPSNHSNGAVDYPSNHSNGAVDHLINGAVGYPSNHTNGAVDYPGNYTVCGSGMYHPHPNSYNTPLNGDSDYHHSTNTTANASSRNVMNPSPKFTSSIPLNADISFSNCCPPPALPWTQISNGCSSQVPLNVMVPTPTHRTTHQNHHHHHQSLPHHPNAAAPPTASYPHNDRVVRNGNVICPEDDEASTSFNSNEVEFYEKKRNKSNKNTNYVPGSIVNPIVSNGSDNPLIDSTRFKKSFDSHADIRKNTNAGYRDKNDCNRFDQFESRNRLLSKKANNEKKKCNVAVHHNQVCNNAGGDGLPVSNSGRPIPSTSRNSYPPCSSPPVRLRQPDHSENNQNSVVTSSLSNSSVKILPPDSCFIPIQPFDNSFVSPSSPSIVIPMSNYNDKEFKLSSSSSSLSSLSSTSFSSPHSVEKLSQERESQCMSQSQTEERRYCDSSKGNERVYGANFSGEGAANTTGLEDQSGCGDSQVEYRLSNLADGNTDSLKDSSCSNYNSSDNNSGFTIREHVASCEDNHNKPLSRQKSRPQSLPIQGCYVKNGVQLDGDCEEEKPKLDNASPSSNLVRHAQLPQQRLHPLLPNNISEKEQEDLTKDFNLPISAVPTVSLDKLPPSTFVNKIPSSRGGNTTTITNNNNKPSSNSHLSNVDSDVGTVDSKSKKINSVVATSETAKNISSTKPAGPRSKSLKEKRRRKEEEMEGEEHQQQREAREKIRRRIKTPVSFKNARLSLYDDRLMSQSLDLDNMVAVAGSNESQCMNGNGMAGTGSSDGIADRVLSRSVWENGTTLFAEMRL